MSFAVGDVVAMVRERKVVGIRTVGKFYRNGNFVLVPLTLVPGAQTGDRPAQWRPTGDGTHAYQCGGHFRYGASHIEAWTTEHGERLRAYRLEIEIEKRTKNLVSAIEQKCLTRSELAAMERTLGITVGAEE